MCFSWTNVPLFNQTVWHLLIFNNCGNLEQGFFLKKKKFNSFARCQAQFMYKLIGNNMCNNYIIWPDSDNGRQLFIRNWTCLSSLNLCVIVWFWNLAASSHWVVNCDSSVHSGSSSIMKLLLGQLGTWAFMLIQCYGICMKHFCHPFLVQVKLNIF